MSLSKRDFLVLKECLLEGPQSQRQYASATGFSLGSVNDALKSLAEQGYVEAGAITQAGKDALAPYKVQNAIIMAAGMSTRFAPFSYERPKGLLRVKGEVLVERQIRQLQEAGITDITLVVGYLKEAFFYLEDKFGVKIRVNAEYATRNNNSTLMLVREKLGNTYICSSDDYFTENVFEPYVYHAYYSANYFEGETDEYCLTTGSHDRITAVTIGGRDSYAMLGHVYFDQAFSKKFVSILETEYDKPETYGKLWEDIYIDHIKELDMSMRAYEPGIIYEFDSLNDLRDFDQDFIRNVDSAIIDNICATLDCQREEIVNIVPIKAGLTNLSFRFDVAGTSYVYRHPGAGTDGIICRESEAFSQKVARDLGIDETYIYQDPKEGWKISKFIDGCDELDYHNDAQVDQALAMGRKLHQCGVSSQWTFNVFEKAVEIIELLKQGRSFPQFEDFGTLYESANKLAAYVAQDNVPLCLCHNDFYAPNFLVKDGYMALIDWEYSAMSDYASDLGTFICCSDYDVEQAKDIVARYFGRKPTLEEERHCLAYVAISGYYWFVWALYKESEGDSVGEWLYLWYRYARDFSRAALALYE
ncbi:MAG: phosphotransferase [Eggerthellales bacterium]|nr:phosphotransferase [Eggerthellales bacterium]